MFLNVHSKTDNSEIVEQYGFDFSFRNQSSQFLPAEMTQNNDGQSVLRQFYSAVTHHLINLIQVRSIIFCKKNLKKRYIEIKIVYINFKSCNCRISRQVIEETPGPLWSMDVKTVANEIFRGEMLKDQFS